MLPSDLYQFKALLSIFKISYYINLIYYNIYINIHEFKSIQIMILKIKFKNF